MKRRAPKRTGVVARQRDVPTLVLAGGALLAVLVPRLLGAGVALDPAPDALQRAVPFVAHTGMLGLAASVALLVLGRRLRPEALDPVRALASTAFLAVAVPTFFAYFVNGDVNFFGDVTYTGILPRRIVTGHVLAFDAAFVRTHDAWGLLPAGPGRWAPLWPVGPALWGVPFALLQRAFRVDEVALADALNQRVTACALAALGNALLFATIVLRTRKVGVALWLSAAFSFGTMQASVCALAISQHTPAVMLVCAALLCLTLGEIRGDSRWFSRAGAPLGLLAAMRPQAAPVALGIAASIAALDRRALPGFALAAVPGVALSGALNHALFGTVLGGYGQFAGGTHFTTPWHTGLAGLLVSPNRGLIVYAPITLLAVPGAAIAWRRKLPVELGAVAGFAGILALHARWDAWWGGWCLPPRFLSEALPGLMVLAGMALAEASLAGQRAARGLAVASIAVNLPLVFFNEASIQWNAFPDIDARAVERAWDWRDWAPLRFRHALDFRAFRDVPAFAFGLGGGGTAVRGDGTWRVSLGLRPDTALRALRLPPVTLPPGHHRLMLRGAVSGARAEGWVEARGDRDVRGRNPVELGAGRSETAAEFDVLREHPVRLDVRVRGAGTLVLDAVRLGR